MITAYVLIHLLKLQAAGRETSLEFCGEVIGYLNGCEIYAAVRHGGARYRFERVLPEPHRYVPASGELFVEPGLLYVRDLGR